MVNSHDVVSIADILGVSSSTVKKYYLLMEENNYRFQRNTIGRVTFSEADLNLFLRLISLKNEPGMTVKKAVKQIIDESMEEQHTIINRLEPSLHEQNFLSVTKEEFREAIKIIEQIEELNKDLNLTVKMINKNLKVIKA
ncbi:hypothetical protein ACIQXQ_09395 [Peribacillus sp. NPDC097198]|uniref:hypothetical protein n=1 Tax=Peribacillus sp. NPDC097198 TaxID=3364397 RepID=UPI00380AD740